MSRYRTLLERKRQDEMTPQEIIELDVLRRGCGNDLPRVYCFYASIKIDADLERAIEVYQQHHPDLPTKVVYDHVANMLGFNTYTDLIHSLDHDS